MLKVFPLVNFQFPTCLHMEAFFSFGISFGTSAPRNRLRPTRMLFSSVFDSCRRLPSGERCHMLRIYFSFTFSPEASDVSALLCGKAQLFPHVLDHNSSKIIFQTWGRSSFWATICPKVRRWRSVIEFTFPRQLLAKPNDMLPTPLVSETYLGKNLPEMINFSNIKYWFCAAFLGKLNSDKQTSECSIPPVTLLPGILLVLKILSVCYRGGLRGVITHALWAGNSERAELYQTGWNPLKNLISQIRSETPFLRMGLNMRQRNNHLPWDNQILWQFFWSFSARICAELPKVIQAGCKNNPLDS